jgi:hypothetical protein
MRTYQWLSLALQKNDLPNFVAEQFHTAAKIGSFTSLPSAAWLRRIGPFTSLPSPAWLRRIGPFTSLPSPAWLRRIGTRKKEGNGMYQRAGVAGGVPDLPDVVKKGPARVGVAEHALLSAALVRGAAAAAACVRRADHTVRILSKKMS